MKIGGLQKLTLIDYPQKPACTVFLAGCNFRCPWCHSSSLVIPEEIEKAPKISDQYFFDFLKSRKELLEGVVICGGEPTIHSELPIFLEKIKNLGYAIKLDTNGSNPKMIQKLLNKDLLNYVAMDVKAPFNRYKEATGIDIDPELLRKSISMIQKMDNYEFRTTFIPGLLTKEDLPLILNEIKGAKSYFLQKFRTKTTINDNYQGKDNFTTKEMEDFKKIADRYVKKCKIR